MFDVDGSLDVKKLVSKKTSSLRRNIRPENAITILRRRSCKNEETDAHDAIYRACDMSKLYIRKRNQRLGLSS